MYLVSRWLGQQRLSLLDFDWLDVLDGLPCWLSVGLTRGGLFYHRHPLQHCCPADRGSVSTLCGWSKRFVSTINCKNPKCSNDNFCFSETQHIKLFKRTWSISSLFCIPHVVVFLEQSIIFNCPLLELHIYTAAIDADDAPDATGRGQRWRKRAAVKQLFRNYCI